MHTELGVPAGLGVAGMVAWQGSFMTFEGASAAGHAVCFSSWFFRDHGTLAANLSGGDALFRITENDGLKTLVRVWSSAR